MLEHLKTVSTRPRGGRHLARSPRLWQDAGMRHPPAPMRRLGVLRETKHAAEANGFRILKDGAVWKTVSIRTEA